MSRHRLAARNVPAGWPWVFEGHRTMAEIMRDEALAGIAGGATVNTLQVVEQILAERRRQAEAKGYSPAHDDVHEMGELARYAAANALKAAANQMPQGDLQRMLDYRAGQLVPPGFTLNGTLSARRKLVVGAALIVAEIERLDRLAADPASPQPARSESAIADTGETGQADDRNPTQMLLETAAPHAYDLGGPALSKETTLLATVARLLRAHLRDHAGPHSRAYAMDIADLNEALAPFDPSPSPPVNQSGRAEKPFYLPGASGL